MKLPTTFLVSVTVLSVVSAMVVWASGEPFWWIMPLWALAVIVGTVIENRRKS